MQDAKPAALPPDGTEKAAPSHATNSWGTDGMRTIAIVGVGLIGGSFALGLRRAGFRGSILGVSSPASLEKALQLGVIDEGLPLEEAAARADLIYLSQPIRKILEILPKLDSMVRPEALITDAGSTKMEILACARKHVCRALFLGGHPMAGKESRGVAEADAGLFANRTYFLAPLQPEDQSDLRVIGFQQWLVKMGAVPVMVDGAVHDCIISYTSHLPQLLSTVLAFTLGEKVDPGQARTFAGPGILDSTRLALSSFDIWGDILSTNREAIATALTAFIDNLCYVRDHLEDPSLANCFLNASKMAKLLRLT